MAGIVIHRKATTARPACPGRVENVTPMEEVKRIEISGCGTDTLSWKGMNGNRKQWEWLNEEESRWGDLNKEDEIYLKKLLKGNHGTV